MATENRIKVIPLISSRSIDKAFEEVRNIQTLQRRHQPELRFESSNENCTKLVEATCRKLAAAFDDHLIAIHQLMQVPSTRYK